jgi:hypothetical protein
MMQMFWTVDSVSNKLFYYKFEIQSWRSDAVFRCSLAARGLWLEMMNMMHVQERYGYLSQNSSPIPSEAIARYCGSSLEQYEVLLAELSAAGVPGWTSNGIIYSRRMVRDEKERSEWNKRQKNHRDAKEVRHRDVTQKSPITITMEDSDFDLFWKNYPRAVGKPAARKAWEKARLGTPMGVLMDGLHRWKSSEQWQDQQFVPHPATFLNQRRWEDQPAAGKKRAEEIEANIGSGPLERSPSICRCGATKSWHMNARKNGWKVDHEFTQVVSA